MPKVCIKYVLYAWDDWTLFARSLFWDASKCTRKMFPWQTEIQNWDLKVTLLSSKDRFYGQIQSLRTHRVTWKKRSILAPNQFFHLQVLRLHCRDLLRNLQCFALLIQFKVSVLYQNYYLEADCNLSHMQVSSMTTWTCMRQKGRGKATNGDKSKRCSSQNLTYFKQTLVTAWRC